MKFAMTLCAIVAAAVFSGYAQVPNTKELRAVRNELRSKIAKKELASVSVAVVRRGKVIWKESLGWADREGGIRATPRTIYALASLSKSITATGLWLLAQRGALDVDDPVEDRLRSAKLEFNGYPPRDLKIRHLLNMEGGIAHQFDYYYDDENERPLTLKHQIERYGFVAFPPGAIHNYSNFSLAIVDQIIADVSGSAFPTFMRRNVFAPLGMTRTFTNRPGSGVACGYDSEGKLLPSSYFLPRGGAGMYSTLDDLIRYGEAHLGRRKLMSKGTLERAHRVDPDAPNPYYSSGWGVLTTDDGRTALLSNGAIAGAATTLLLVPSENLEIVVLTNTTVGNDFTDATAFRIAGSLIDGYSNAIERLFAKVEPTFADKPFQADGYAGTWTGSIRTSSKNVPVKLTVGNDGTIEASIDGADSLRLTNVHMEGRLVVAGSDGSPSVAEVASRPHSLSFQLLRSGDSLVGIVTAIAKGSRPRFFRPFYIKLTR